MTTIRVTVSTSVVRVTQPDGTITRVANVGAVQGPPGPRLVELVYQISGIVPASRTFIGYVASADITFIPADAVALCGTANTVNASISITDLSNNVLGSIAFLGGATVGTVTISATTLHKNDGLKFVHPITLDTMTDLVVTIPANRGS